MADDLRAGVEIVADTTDLQTKLVAAKAQLQALEAQLRQTAAELAKLGVAEGAAARATADLAARTSAARAQVQAIQAQLDQLAAASRTAGNAVQETGGKVEAGMQRGGHATAGMAREVIVLAHEFVSGNFSRIPGSIMVLTERMGGLGTAITALKGPMGVALAGVGALAGGFYYLAHAAYEAEKAMRGVYNARLLTGGGGAAGAEAAAAAGAAAIRATGLANEREANDYAAAVMKAGELSRANADKLMSLGPALSTTMGGWKEATKFAEETFKDTSAIERYIEKHGLLAGEEATAYEVAKRSGDAYRIQGIALDALARQLSGASGAIETYRRQTEDYRRTQGLVGPDNPFAAVAPSLPLRMPEVPVGAEPAIVQQRLRWEQEYNRTLIERRSIESDIAKMRAAGVDPAMIKEAENRLAQLHGPGEAGNLQKLRAQLLEQNAEIAKQGAARQDISRRLAENEVRFWQRAAEDRTLTDQQRLAAAEEAWRAQIRLAEQTASAEARGARAGAAAARKSYQEFADAERLKLAEAQGDAGRIAAIYDEWAAEAKRVYGADSAQFLTVEREKTQALNRLAREAAAAQAKAKREEYAEFAAAERLKITEAEGATGRILAIYREWADEAKKLFGADSRQYLDVLRGMEKAAQQASERMVKQWGAAFDRIGERISRTLTDALFNMPRDRFTYRPFQDAQGHWLMRPQRESGAAQLALGLGRDIATELGGAIEGAVSKSLAQSLFGEGTKTFGEGLAKMIGIGQPGGLFGTGLFSLAKTSEDVTQVTATTANTTALTALTTAVTANTAALGAATAGSATGSAASLAGGGASLAGAAAGGGGFFGWLGGLFSFAGGGIVPSAAGGMTVPRATLAMLHAREMVLPADLSEGMQNMIASGGAGGDTHLHFHGPADGPAIERFFTPLIRKALPGLMRGEMRTRSLLSPA